MFCLYSEKIEIPNDQNLESENILTPQTLVQLVIIDERV